MHRVSLSFIQRGGFWQEKSNRIIIANWGTDEEDNKRSLIALCCIIKSGWLNNFVVIDINSGNEMKSRWPYYTGWNKLYIVP